MACYAYSVLTRWFSSVYSGARSETPLEKESKQVVVTSSVTPSEVNNISHSPETIYDIPDSYQLSNRKQGDTVKAIIIPVDPQ